MWQALTAAPAAALATGTCSRFGARLCMHCGDHDKCVLLLCWCCSATCGLARICMLTVSGDYECCSLLLLLLRLQLPLLTTTMYPGVHVGDCYSFIRVTAATASCIPAGMLVILLAVLVTLKQVERAPVGWTSATQQTKCDKTSLARGSCGTVAWELGACSRLHAKCPGLPAMVCNSIAASGTAKARGLGRYGVVLYASRTELVWARWS